MRKKRVTSLIVLLGIILIPTAVAAAAPQRIVSLGPLITEMIYLLGADDRLIANTTYCNIPDDAQTKIKIGSLIQADVEKIISLDPDIVIANPLAKENQLKLMRRLGIRVEQYENPATFEKICNMMKTLGSLLGKEAKAQAIIAQARTKVNETIDRTSRLAPRKVFIQIGFNPLHTSPKDTFINEYITFSGGINVAANEKSGNYSREKVLENNPDVILIATMGSDKTGAEKEKKKWMGYHALKAAKNNEIYVLDPEIICSPTPVSFAEALAYIVPLIHPELRGKEE